jgi:D-glycero-alpha-D-manno-heptose-7-phosphate kinase
MYKIAIKSGAIGGKLCGAGNGGFLLLCVPIEKQENVKKSLKKLFVPIKFDNLGSQIIMYNNNDI